jgi:hypothetical protein
VYSKKGQLYTIHGLIQSTDDGRPTQMAIPLVYALLPNKCKSTYLDFFQSLKDVSKVPLNPEHIIIDFEISVLDALKSTFTETKIRGCWFHFSQSLFRHAQALGLQPKYQSDRNFKNKIKLLSALAFVPANHVQQRFREIVAKMPTDLIPLCHYFEKTYVGSIAKTPLFDPSFWTIHDRVKKKVPRTSNFCEGWHNRFAKCIKYTKPPLWRFLIGILAEQTRSENKLEKFASDGKLKLMKKKSRAIERRLISIVKEYKRHLKPTSFLNWSNSLTYFVPEA